MASPYTQFDGGPDVQPVDSGQWMDTDRSIAPGPGPTGPPARAHFQPPPWHAGVPPFPQFDWSIGQDIPGSVLDWFRSTVGPLASWYTMNRDQNIGPLQNWAGGAMEAVRGAGLPQPLMQALFERGINEFQNRGIGGPGAWSPEGDAYRLWSQFLGMNHPQMIGGAPGPTPNPQLPQQNFEFSQAQPTPAISMEGPSGGGGGMPPAGTMPPIRIDPSQWDWLRGLKPPPGIIGGGPGPVPNPGPGLIGGIPGPVPRR